MDLMQLLDELEAELSDKKGFFGKKVDLDKCYNLVRQIKINLPSTLRETEYVMENKRKILENADIVAKNTIREAEERAEHMIDNSEIMRLADLESKKMMESTMMQCDGLVHHTKDHLDNMFKETEQFLLSTLTMIRNNREELRGAVIINKK
jgi:putative cell wall-binding protein